MPLPLTRPSRPGLKPAVSALLTAAMVGAALVAAVMSPGAGAVARPVAQSFGRWQQRPRSCSILLPELKALGCRAVQLDQRNPEVLRLSLLVDGPGRAEQQLLTLVGQSGAVGEPMACRDGLCRLERLLVLQLSSASLARFDGRGLAQTLPHTWAIAGECRLEPARLSCAGAGAGGSDDTWSLDAQLR